MSNPIDLYRLEFEKRRYNNNIDTSFTQFGVTPQIETPVLPTIDEFFQYYNELFYQIPKEGIVNSHQYLVEQSSAYIGQQQQLEEIVALQEEITDLRRQLLESRNDAINTIADVLDTANLNLPPLPEIPNLEIPSEFSVDISSNISSPQEELTKKEERRKRREERRKARKERRN